MLQFSKIAWRGSQKLVLQSCFLGLSRSGGGVRISIVEPNPAPCPVWSAQIGQPPSGRFKADGSPGRAVETSSQVWRQGLETQY